MTSPTRTARGYAPGLYPDEIVYSLVARWARHLRRPSLPQFHRWLLGCDTMGSIAMPRHLSRLAMRLGSGVSTDQLIAQHTLWRLWEPFLSSNASTHIHHAMEQGRGTPPAAYVAAQAGPAIPVPPALRFCTACAIEDEGQYGEPYWHRLHQAPGVSFCPVHEQALRVTTVSLRETDGTLEDLKDRPSAPLFSDALSRADPTALIAIARDVAWYLGHNPDAAELGIRYQQSLDQHGWLRASGQMRTRYVRHRLQAMLSDSMWAWMASTWAPDAPYTWIEAILRQTGSVHPIRHILLQRFLASDVETFWGSSAPERPSFSVSAWPCKNPVSDHEGEFRIANVTYHRAANSGWLLGTGACPDCGFTYRQRATNGQPTDDRSFRIIDPGAVWSDAFTADWEDDAVPLGVMVQRFHLTYAMVHRMAYRLSLASRTSADALPDLAARWEDPAISLATLAQQYGVAVGTLVRRAEAMGLPPRHPGGRRRRWDREVDRERWRTLCHQHPDATRSALRRLDSSTFARLRKHDKAWLDQYTPARSRAQTNTRPIDWDMRDRVACARITKAVNEWYGQPRRPRRCTPFRVSRTLGMPFPVWPNLGRMPRTAAALSVVRETDERFAVRRLQWAANHLGETGKPVTTTNLRNLVTLPPETRRHPDVLVVWNQLLAKSF